MRFPPPFSLDIWHWLQVKLERLGHFLYRKGIVDFLSEPLGIIIFLTVILAFISFRRFRRK